MTDHGVVPVKTYVAVFVALLALMAATVGIYHVDLGPFNTVAALGIALAKALLVLWVFMHVKWGELTTWIVIMASAFWIGILLVLTLADYASRPWPMQ